MAAITICPTCGQAVTQTGVGRPRERHDKCRKLAQILSWTEDLLNEIEFDPKAAIKVRKQLWNMANAMNRVGHPTKAQ